MLCILLGLNIANVPVKLGLFSCLQLRNLVWATSKHDVYLMQNYSLMHWSSLLRRGKEVLNVAKPIEPTQVSSILSYLESICLIVEALKN